MKHRFALPLTTAFLLATAATTAQVPQRPKMTPLPLSDAAAKALAARDSEVSQLEMDARNLLKAENTIQAIRTLEKALTIYAFDEDRILLGDIYSKQGKPDDVIRVMKPIFYHDIHSGGDSRTDPNARMLYVLALLDKHQWDEAVTIYEPTINANPHWQLPEVSLEHTFPNVRFTFNFADYNAMRAQAHLILGATQPSSIIYADEPDSNPDHQREYMLMHLKQSLKYNAQSPDAHFLSGLLLTKLNRFDEARKELQNATKYASDAAQPEIATALKDLREKVIQKKVLDARKAYEVLHPDAP